MEIEESEYQFSSLLNDVVNMIQIRANQKGLAFRLELEESLPDGMYGDEARIRQIIVNILSNAIKYTERGSVTFTVRLERKNADTAWIMIAVKDTGIGIRKEDKDKLFVDFERLDSKKNQAIEGTGLGLAITHRLVEKMHGRITVDSVYGKGSVFTVILPQKVKSWEPIGDFKKRHQLFLQSMNQKKCQESLYAPESRILVVDDTDMNLMVVKGLLKRTGICVDTCMSGGECLERMEQQKYDVILLDHMMPEMDGIETLKCSKELKHNLNAATPVIALTANAIVGAREMYLSEGFDDYLSKPIAGEELEKLLLTYVPKEKQKKLPESKESQTDNLIREEVVQQEITEAAAEGSTMLEQLSFLDTGLGLGYCCNDEGFYLEMLKSYCEGDKRKALTQAYQTQNWSDYRISVHSLKSTSLSIGAVELSEAAKALEMAAKDSNVEYIQENHAQTMEVYGALLEKLKEALKSMK